MVQKTEKKGLAGEAIPGAKRRGRPPAYDRDEALERALDAFWRAGYAATSLDDLTAATGMNRPSLYGAFGDKREIYLLAMERYRESSRAGMEKLLSSDLSLRDALAAVFRAGLSVYLGGGASGARGCFLIGTAATEAVENRDVRDALAAALREFDHAFESRLRRAQKEGELPASADPAALARVASAILHTLAIRARSGEKRSALEAIASTGLDLICGPGPARR
jgi:AcrR family transcriptional regulator